MEFSCLLALMKQIIQSLIAASDILPSGLPHVTLFIHIFSPQNEVQHADFSDHTIFFWYS